MSLKQKLTDDLQGEMSMRLHAIHDHAGLLEEADALAATLRSHGVKAAAAGWTMRGISSIGSPASVSAHVVVMSNSAEEIHKALQDADLQIAAITDVDGFASASVVLKNLSVSMAVAAATARQLAELLAAEEAAHA